MQFSVRLRNARVEAIEDTVGEGPTLEIRSGEAPEDCAAEDTGTLLASMTLPADWLDDPANGAKTILGIWQDLAADAEGEAGHFRIKSADDDECDIQGSVTATGGGGDMTLDNISLAVGQQVTITQFTLTDGNA